MSDSNVIGHLKPASNGPWVTFKEAKRQIRQAAREKGLALSSFRPRRINKSVLMVPLSDGSGYVTAQRKPAAPIQVIRNLAITDPELKAQIEAEANGIPVEQIKGHGTSYTS